jgi:hypothetical protein
MTLSGAESTAEDVSCPPILLHSPASPAGSTCETAGDAASVDGKNWKKMAELS